jgi:Protein of unknown function (DUF1553)/Protein of unknown function (DUF1549)/Planctomycete cytochrome C
MKLLQSTTPEIRLPFARGCNLQLPWQVILFLVFIGVMCSRVARVAAQDTVEFEFNRDVRPILSDNCFFCHGPDRNKREADLRLDTPEGLFGTPDAPGPVIPGRLDESELIRRILAEDDEEVMPPRNSHKSLTQQQINVLKAWVAAGGKYQGHWAFLPIKATSSSGTPLELANSLDQLVASELQRFDQAFSAEADPITLVRRIHFDLIGLPPRPEVVDAFEANPTPEAWSDLVEQLLASPHFGERLSIWWLDLARYADTVGYHGDQQVSVSPFRDYVIQSFNANKPFDQFTIEQLAGDLLPDATREQRIASGYNRLGMMSAEGGVQDKEYLAKYIAERVRNVSGTWLGVTLGCAECHDHKFDPFTMRDFYRFEAFFADISERGLYAGANDDGNWGPSILVPTDEQARSLQQLDREIAEVQELLDKPTAELEAAQRNWETNQPKWMVIDPSEMLARNGTTLTQRDDQAILASGNAPPTEICELTFQTVPENITGIRLEVFPDDSLPQKGPGRAGNGNFVLSEIRLQVVNADGQSSPVQLQHPQASYEQTGATGANPYGKWSIAAATDGDVHGSEWGWAIMEQAGRPHQAVFELASPLIVPSGSKLVVILEQNHSNPNHTLGCFRLAATTDKGPFPTSSLPESIAQALGIPREDRTPAQQQELAAFYRTIARELDSARQRLQELAGSREKLRKSITTTLVTESVTPRTVRVLNRGNWMDETGEVVSAGLPEFLASADPIDRPLTRLDLANWLVSRENTLTARVIVNRIWKLYFGAGLSRKLDDAGAQGDWPSHPELLDMLAADFQEHWDVKRLIRAMVLSRTYRQSSSASPDLREQDPFNRWLARQGRFRLDAELVRDNALAVSGLLEKRIGGPSVFPYQPPGYWSYLNFPTREWKNSSGESLYRRGLYTHWQRQYLHPGLMAFDAPGREECTADRPRSNTPLQSLVLLNDPAYVEASRVFAEKILQQAGVTNGDRIRFAFREALSRDPTVEETAVIGDLLQKHTTEFAADSVATAEFLKIGARPVAQDLPPAELAAWANVARTIFNLHEFVTRQ